MALSRKRRLWLAFAATAIGAGSGIALWKVYPALTPLMGTLLALAGSGIFVSGRGRKPAAEERAALEPHDPTPSRTRADNTARPADKTDTITTKVRCLHCQHVQTVAVSQKTFVCEQCKAHLKRRPAPAKSS
jgi:ribosomal protein S27E